MNKHMRMSDRIFVFSVYILLSLITVVVLFPLIHVVAASFSSPSAVTAGRVTILPVEFSFRGYEAVFRYKSIKTGYLNSFLYMILGTAINIAMTLVTAYPLAQKDLPYRGLILKLFTFTMFFGGGMVPNYILLRDLRMLNSIWAMVIPGAIGVYNMIIMRTFIQESIPDELYEAANIDGCSDIHFLLKIVIPLSSAAIAVVTLHYAVAHWNSYFDAFLYLNNPKLRPLQIVLREILIMNTVQQDQLLMEGENFAQQGMVELLKYSLIIVASVPMLIIYPFVQKYFVKGVMIGSIKG